LTISSSRGVSWCKISPDGRYWVFGYGEGIKIFSRNLQTELFSELIISNFPTNYTSIPCVAFSADDKFLAIAFNEQTFLDSYQDNITKNNILFFNINENFLQEKKLVFEKTIHFISFITNAELLINFLDQSVSTKGLGDYSFESPLLITLQHGKILACNIHDKNTFMITQQKSVNSVVTQRGTKVLSDFYTLSNIEEDILAISNDGNFILSYNHGEYQYIVKKKSPSEIIYQVIQNPGQKTGVFSKNSKYLLYSALNKIVLFDIEKKRISKEFSSSDTISFCEFSPNGREVIIGNTSGMIDIYDISYLLPQTDIISLIAQQFSLEQEGFIDYEQYIHYFGVKNSFDYIINSEKITLAGVSAFQRTAAVDQSRKMTNQQVREQLNKIMTPSSNELAFTRALLMSIAHPHGLAKININDFSLKEVYVNVTKSVNFSFYETWNIALELRYFKNVDLEPKTALDKLKGVADIKGLNNYFSIHVQYDLTQMYITLKQDTIKLTFLGTLKAEESAIKQQLEKTLASVARAPSPILPPALASPQKAMPAENSVIAKIREVAEIIRKDE
jgi:WD40 repeat protein